MSWDDLVAMVARGTLGRLERVKEGADAEWLAAEAVPGLFPAADETDFDVTPPAIKPLATSSSDDDDFDLAPSVMSTSSDDTDFDVTPAAAQPEPMASPGDGDFDLAPSVRSPPPEETDFDVAEQPRGKTSPALSRDQEFEATASSVSRPLAVTSPPGNQTPAATALPGTGTASPAPPSPTKKTKAKSSGDGSASSQRALAMLGGVIGALGAVYLAYLGIVTLAAMGGPNYDEILAGYDQLFQQTQAARSDGSAVGNPQATMAFLGRLKALRDRLRNTDADSADTQLVEAGAMLAQLYATAQAIPNSQEAQERSSVESEYLAKMSAVRSKLAK